MQKDKPQLPWYEYAWSGLPLILVFAGGALGGAVGGCAFAMNIKLFRSKATKIYQYGISGSTSLMSVLIWYALAMLISAMFHPH